MVFNCLMYSHCINLPVHHFLNGPIKTSDKYSTWFDWSNQFNTLFNWSVILEYWLDFWHPPPLLQASYLWPPPPPFRHHYNLSNTHSAVRFSEGHTWGTNPLFMLHLYNGHFLLWIWNGQFSIARIPGNKY